MSGLVSSGSGAKGLWSFHWWSKPRGGAIEVKHGFCCAVGTRATVAAAAVGNGLCCKTFAAAGNKLCCKILFWHVGMGCVECEDEAETGFVVADGGNSRDVGFGVLWAKTVAIAEANREGLVCTALSTVVTARASCHSELPSCCQDESLSCGQDELGSEYDMAKP